MSTELIINASLPETRIALMENGEIQDLLIERASGKGIVGNIYKGRVTRVLPGMQAAFVDIGLEKAAFLYVDDVFVHSEMWEEEEGAPEAEVTAETVTVAPAEPVTEGAVEAQAQPAGEAVEAAPPTQDQAPVIEDAEVKEWADDLDDEQGDEDEEDDEPVGMCPPPEGGDEGQGGGDPQGTVRPQESAPAAEGGASEQNAEGQQGEGASGEGRRRRHRRGRRGGRFRKRNRDGEAEQPQKQAQGGEQSQDDGDMPESFHAQVSDSGDVNDSDRGTLTEQSQQGGAEGPQAGRPEHQASGGAAADRQQQGGGRRPEFKEQRGRDRRIKSKQPARSPRGQANIQDLLKEGQEVLVQVAKDPISTKGARLTCHISLPGRHLVCMPTIDHVGVSRRIERDDERRKLREHVERYRPKGLGFIVRTASGRQQSEKRIKQDIDYLTRLWTEIREKANTVTAPALVYEDLNSVLRAIRDWVTEDIDKIVVDSRYHYNDIQRFVSHFMPSLKQKVELYHGDVPIFDAYGISTELARALERKVWLKSGGYIVVDQAEALVAIDVNTGRFVGKKNLEDTILKTNLEAVQEIAYQLRLRNCGGIIILDLIDMEKEENKQRVYRALEEALKKDRARPTILKISELGLVEMTRKRTRDTMVRALCESCAHCEGKGFVKSKQTVAYEVLREIERAGIERDMAKILIQAHPDVIDILAIDERETLDQLERRYRKQIYLQAVVDYHLERFEVTGDKPEKGERAQQIQVGRGDRNDRDRGRNRGRDRDRGDRNRNRNNQQPQPVSGVLVKPLETPIPHEGAAEHASPQSGDESGAYAAAANGAPMNGAPARAPGEEHDEEDRLAFLRAQAAQDAALARVGGPGGAANGEGRRNNNGGGQGQGGDRDQRGGRRRRGRRGGKFRREKHAGDSGGGADAGMGLGRGPDAAFRVTPNKPMPPQDGGGGSSGGGDSTPQS